MMRTIVCVIALFGLAAWYDLRPRWRENRGSLRIVYVAIYAAALALTLALTLDVHVALLGFIYE